MSEKLKNCPFCGGSDLDIIGNDWFVSCNTCDTSGPKALDPEDTASAFWNTRIAPDPKLTEASVEGVVGVIFDNMPPDSWPKNMRCEFIADGLFKEFTIMRNVQPCPDPKLTEALETLDEVLPEYAKALALIDEMKKDIEEAKKSATAMWKCIHHGHPARGDDNSYMEVHSLIAVEAFERIDASFAKAEKFRSKS